MEFWFAKHLARKSVTPARVALIPSLLLAAPKVRVFCFAVSWVFAFGTAKQRALLCRVDGAFVFMGFNLFYGGLSLRYGHLGQAFSLLWHSHISGGKQKRARGFKNHLRAG